MTDESGEVETSDLQQQPQTDVLSSFTSISHKRQEDLLRRLSQTPMHAVSLRRSKYKVIRRITRELKWPIVKDKDASFVWLDKWDIPELSNLRNYKVGHFPGMGEVGSKCSLGRTLSRIRNEFPHDYDFFPLSFVLPTEREKLAEYDEAYRSQMKRALKKKLCVNSAEGHHMANPGGFPALAPPPGCWAAPGAHPQPQAGYGDRLVYIVKPDAGSRGQGIYLALSLEDIEEFGGDNNDGNSDENEDEEKSGPRHRSKQAPNWRPSSGASGGSITTDEEDDAAYPAQKPLVMVQAYLPRPLLMDSRKFDLRIYVLVTSVFPTLRLFVYRQGLVRFATVTYAAPNESNISSRRMFLTNYAVNKPGERPRSPKTGIDDVPDGMIRSSAPPPRFDSNPGGGADDNGDDSEEGEDGEGNVGLASATRRAPLPTREKAIELVRARLGCKWTLTSLFESLEAQGIDTERLWERIKDVITKTILAVRPTLAHKYKAARPHLKFEPAPVIDKPKRKTIPRPFFSSRPSVNVNPPRDDSEKVSTPVPLTSLNSLNMDNASAITAAAAAAIASATASLAPPAPVPLASLVSSTGIFGGSISGIRSERLASESLKKKNEETHTKGVPAMGAALFGLGLVGTPVTLVNARPLPTAKAPISRKAGGQRVAYSVNAVSASLTSNSALSVATIPLSQRSSSAEPRTSTSANDVGSVDSDSISVAASTSASSTTASHVSDSTTRIVQSRVVENATDRGLNSSKRRSASAAAPEDKVKDADVAAASVAWGAGSGVSAKGANEMTLEDDDGEQGFRCFELMGLDIILDMSHCVCEHSVEHQNLQSKDPSRWNKLNKAGLPRCQPRPVLLEINQSCSMHSDSDLDRVVKGDVVTDAFNLSAPDEQWLLQQFAEAIKVGGGLAAVSASAGSSDLDVAGDCVSPQDSTVDISPASIQAKNAAVASVLTAPPVGPSPVLMKSITTAETTLSDPNQSALISLKSNTGTVIDNRNCMNDFPKAHKMAVDMVKAAIEESAALLHAFRRGYPPVVFDKNSTKSARSSTSVSTEVDNTPIVSSSTEATLSIQAQRIEMPVPWTPSSMGSLYTSVDALAKAWQQEIWFGQPWHLRDKNSSVGSNFVSALKDIGPLSQAPGFSNVVRTVMALKKKVTTEDVDPSLPNNKIINRQTKEPPPAWSLGTVPQLSPRAQLVLLLRRSYEHQHIGGFERLSPPMSPQLAERYRRIIEYIPPSMRETFAFAKRRMEALALRAATEAKRSALLTMKSK